MRFATSSTISAPAPTVWAVLTDLPSWPTWNTTVSSTEGQVELGVTVKVTVTANPGRTFGVKVTTLDAPSRMVWTGGMPLGLFRGVRTCTLAGSGDSTEFSMVEDYSGPLSSMVTRSIPDLQPSFEEFAHCLKARAEAVAGATR